MTRHSHGAIVFGAAAAMLAAACGDQEVSPVAPSGAPAKVVTAETCEAIDFNGFAHGDGVTSVSLPTLGLTLNVTSAPNVHPNGNPNPNTTPRAWDTDTPFAPANWEDNDLLWNGGSCPGCNGLGALLIIEDERGFPFWGDYAYGGMLTLSGDFSGGEYYVQSFKAADVDLNEQAMRLYVDGVMRAQSGVTGNGTVQTVNVTDPHTIAGGIAVALGTPGGNYSQTGSGGIDDIMICRVEQQMGDEGCTLGYWKQRHHFDSWTGYTTDQALDPVFDIPNSYGLDGDTFLMALGYKGGPGTIAAARLLLKQAVAALLNAASPAVDYALTTGEITTQVNAALASGNRNTMLALKDQLDAYNNAGCPLN